MKKYICILMIVIMVTSLSLSAGAENVDITNWGYVYGTYSIATQTYGNWITGQAYDSLPWDVTIDLSDRTLLYVASLDYITDKTPFEQFYTYHFTYSLTTNENISSWLLSSVKTSTYAGMAQYRQDPLNKGVALDDIFEYSSVYVKNTTANNTIKLDVIFSVTTQTDYCTIFPLFLYANASSSSVSGLTIQLDSFTAVRDYDQEFYNSESAKLQQEIKDSIDSGFADVNGNLEDIEGILSEDPSHTPDTSTLGEDIDELADIDAEINAAITKPITLPDGTTIQTDANTLSSIKDWMISTYNAPEYDSTAGEQYARVFEVFMPYLGSVIFISLLLGLVIAFLTGRRNTA